MKQQQVPAGWFTVNGWVELRRVVVDPSLGIGERAFNKELGRHAWRYTKDVLGLDPTQIDIDHPEFSSVKAYPEEALEHARGYLQEQGTPSMMLNPPKKSDRFDDPQQPQLSQSKEIEDVAVVETFVGKTVKWHCPHCERILITVIDSRDTIPDD